MRTLRILAEQPVGLILGFTIASILFLAAFTLALATGKVLATHDATGNVHVCVNHFTSQARFVAPGQPPNCTANELLVNLASGAAAADIDARLTELEERLACIQSADGANPGVDDIVFTGCNVQIVNGLGNTETTNELGNLIVGYNENSFGFDRSGSHNLVVGIDHDYGSYGGFVAGQTNQITGIFASVSGGEGNRATGENSSVSGGAGNRASGFRSSVSGGFANTASGDSSSVTGGRFNDAISFDSSVSGGQQNTASGTASTVSGGEGNEATSFASSVSGGHNRTTNSADPAHDWRGGSLIEDD